MMEPAPVSLPYDMAAKLYTFRTKHDEEKMILLPFAAAFQGER
jgi:hypothetical protein